MEYFSANFKRPIFFVLALAWIAATASGGASATDLIIQNVTLISPERAAPLHNATVSIHDGRIEQVFDHVPASVAGIPVLDGTGLYLTPGLMDSHLHTAVIPGLGFHGGERAEKFAAMTALYEQQFERSVLYHGVTQFLDPAAFPALLQRSREREMAPDIFFCGAAPLATGYPALFMDPSAIEYSLPYRVYETAPAGSPPDGVDLSRHSPEAVVRRMADDGAICLKLFFEDGWDMRSDWPMLSEDSVERMVRAAHAANLKVVAHANALDMQQLAVKSGVDVLGHGLWNWNQYRDHQGIPEEIRQHLGGVRAAGIGYQPTLRVMYSMRELFTPGMLDNPALKKVVPAALLDWYRSDAAQAFKQELAHEDFEGLPDERIVTLMGRTISQSERSLVYVAESGHRLLLASDHPATPGHANHPGLSSYQELVHMADLGVPLVKLLAAATINNAEMFGLDDRYGSIEPGKIANLLLLDSSPLESVKAYDRIRWVVMGGRAIARDELAADYSGGHSGLD
jgi:imidazolonepropionase-like amidohydrolase